MQIGFDPEYRRGKRPHLGEERFGALIDTGADQSFVDPAVADRVLMPQVDWTVLRATDGTRRTRVHLAQVYIDLPKLTILYGRFADQYWTVLRADGTRRTRVHRHRFTSTFRS